MDGDAVGREVVELGELAFACGQADPQALDFAEPALLFGFGEPVDEVSVDFFEPGLLSWVNAKEWASDTSFSELLESASPCVH